MILPPLSSSHLVLSCAQMRSVDAAAMEQTGLPTLMLMENAGRGVAESIWRRLSAGAGARYARGEQARPGAVAVVCGGGNNGGDGLVVARQLSVLAEGQVAVRVLMVASPGRLTGDAAVMWRALRGLAGVTVADWSDVTDPAAWARAMTEADVIVDAIFGTGLRADVGGTAAVAIGAINTTAALKVSVDIPSGLDGDTGRPRGAAVRADVTVTVGARKLGLVMDPEAGVGELEVVGLGVPLALDPALGPFCFWTNESTVRATMPARKGAAHKGTGGHLIVVAGSPGKTGAALLSSRAALRSGAG
ncbi:MAG: NAD(P)H-hydrate epimerase, partial [Polyangia bacterium]